MTLTSPTLAPPAAQLSETAPGLGARRAPRHLLLGLALVVGFSLLFAVVALRVDPATPVLALARSVPAGAVITDADLTVVRIVPDPGMRLFAETDRSSVVGTTAAVPLAEGTVLSPSQVGAPQWPAAGQSVVAVQLPNGRVPAGLVSGSQVTVLIVPTGDAGEEGVAPAAASASVVEATAPDMSGNVVVSLLLPTADAHGVALAGDGVALVLESPR